MGKTYLVELVRDTPPLWDQRDKNNHNRDLRPKLWDEMGEKLNVTGRYRNNKEWWQRLLLIYVHKMSFILVLLFQNGSSCNACLLMIYFVREQMYHNVVLRWTFSAINLLVLWRCSCSRSVKVCVESVSYIVCFFWGSTEWYTAEICCGMTGSMNLWISWRTEGSCVVPSRPVLTSFIEQIHLTVRSALLTSVSVALLQSPFCC